MKMHMHKTLICCAISLLLAGCAAPMPTDSSALPGAAADIRSDITPGWWRSFGSAELDDLIEQAQAHSFDIAAASARVRQAETFTRIAGAALFPEITGRLDASGATMSGAGVDGGNYGAGLNVNLSASYDTDLWGRNQAGRDEAQAGLRASAYDRDAVQLVVTTGVASSWLQAVALRERIGIAHLNLDSAERLLTLVESRARAGAAMPLALAQQRGLVASLRRSSAALRQQADAAETAVALLLGQAGKVQIRQASLAALQLPAIGAGLQSDLIARRPDIARAEARLFAADANVAAARAAMLPSLSLTGGLRFGSGSLRTVFDNPLYSLAAGLAAPIFDAGRLAAGRDLAQARRAEMLTGYRSVIVSAFGELDTALDAVAGIDAQALAQAEELVQARRALAIAQARYRAGADTLLTLLDAQRTLYATEDAAVQLKALRLQAAVALYKALGGGWRQEPV